MVPAGTKALLVAAAVAVSPAGALAVAAGVAAAVGAALAAGVAEAVFAVASAVPEPLLGSSLDPQPHMVVRIARATATRIVLLMSSPW
jgi:hypothetical protein